MKKKKKKAGPRQVDAASLMRFFKDAGRPLRKADIIKFFGGKKADKHGIKQVIGDLLHEGRIIQIKGAYGLADSMNLVTGTLQMQRSGIGFVLPDDKRRKDIFIGRDNLGDAWHGDRVAVAVVPGKRRGKNQEGRIARVVERGRSILPSRVNKGLGRRMFLVEPSDPRVSIKMVIEFAEYDNLPEIGDVILARPGDKLDYQLYAADAVESLGDESNVDVQERLVKADHDIPMQFPDGVLAEAAELPEVPHEEDFAGRKDLRELPLVTIDGAKAKDFDDAVYVEKEPGGWHLIVAIADVAHYVAEGSRMDAEAVERANSYYFPRSVEPMFPEALSNGLCSLNPDVPRLAMVADIHFDASGTPHGETFYSAVIKSHARLTYAQVQRALFEDNAEEREAVAPVLPMLEDAEALARVLNKVRSRRGSLDFDLPEPEIHFNIYGEAVDIRPRVRNFAHQIIEEFMIAANEAVARFLTDKQYPCMYRVHPQPDPGKLHTLADILAVTTLSDKIPREFSPVALQGLLDAARETDMEFLVSRLVLRSMAQAKYEPENAGHFGLASECYCHFTSPIRRYADLLVHRSLKAALRGDTHTAGGYKAMKTLGDNLSGRERVAMEAERDILKRLTILFLQDKVGSEFNGVVNGVSDFGFWVELTDVMAEGMVRLSTMNDDYYNYLPDRHELVGQRTRKRIHLGLKVRVQLNDVNLGRLEVNLELCRENAGKEGQ
jgi:ribonuclease R